jgi:hypothetical protein
LYSCTHFATFFTGHNHWLGAVMKQKAIKVFLDANVVIGAGKPPGGPLFERVVDLVSAGFIDVITTDLTKSEVAKKHIENDYDVIKDIGKPHFRKIVEAALGATLPEVEKADIKEVLLKKYSNEVEAMFAALKAKALSIDTVRPSVVFNDYSAEKGFFSGERKRYQFADAFIFECLRAEASEDAPLTIVSNDGDYDGPTAAEKFISVVKSIPDLFEKLDLEVERPDVDAFLAERKERIKEIVDTEVNNWGLQVTDVEDAEIDKARVTNVELTDVKSFEKVTEDGDLLVIGSMEITAMVSFTHPNWENAIYDSEDKVLLAFEDVSGETEITLEVDFSMSIVVDDEGKPEDIDQFSFRSDDFVWVELHADDWIDY